MNDKIQGKVLRVLSDQDIVLDKGEADGVKEGDYIAIIDNPSSGIDFVQNGKGLGKLTTFKASLRITQVTANLSIASTYRMINVNVGGLGLGVTGAASYSHLISPPREEKRIQKIEGSESVNAKMSKRKVSIEEDDVFWVVPKHIADSGFSL